MSGPNIVVIGGGVAGLAAAYDLGRKGIAVTLLESRPELGGLASSFDFRGAPIERFYHFICRADTDLVQLVDELGIGSKLHWRQTRTSFFHDGRMYSFGTPLDLVRFTPVPFAQRLRFGFNILQSRYRRNWQKLDDRTAKEWLVASIGKQGYSVIWDPLLRVKFGELHDQISAAWIWHRIWRVASSRERIWQRESMGYLEQGSATLVEALAARIRQYPNISTRCNMPVSEIEIEGDRARAVRLENGDLVHCDAVISTVALPVLAQMAPALPPTYLDEIAKIKYIGVVCMMLALRRPLTNSFWVNTHDPLIPFNGFIEYTNLNPRPDLDCHIVYVPFYLPITDERFRRQDHDLFVENLDALRCLVPGLSAEWVEDYFVFRETHAQAICHRDFARRVPGHQTPVRNLYITDSVQFYPEDRTMSAAIRLGRRVAKMTAEANNII
jgi:protoporphyrinogen oxidase